MINTKTKKIIWLIVRAVITLCAFGTGGYFLYRYEYFTAIGDVDNLIGMFPVAFALIFASGITALLWMRHTKQFAAVSIALAVIVVLSAALFPNALRGNWWLGGSASGEQEAKPDMSVFVPFSENSQTAKPDAPSTLKLAGSMPVMDGATALYPVYAAFAEATYIEATFSADTVLCTNTTGAYNAIIAGERDVVFCAGASDKQIAAAEAAGAELVFTPVGREAFVFLTGKDNPVKGVTTQQIRNIYSGKTAYWSTLGWNEGGKIIAWQRPEGSGSQTGLQRLMGDLPIQSPQPLPDESLIGSNSLMQQVAVEWKGVQPAMGYSYRYYAATMFANPNAKMLEVDGVAPTPENIGNGTYPFVSSFYAVTNGAPTGNTKLLIDWILSSQGQELVVKTGYSPFSG